MQDRERTRRKGERKKKKREVKKRRQGEERIFQYFVFSIMQIVCSINTAINLYGQQIGRAHV